MISCVCTDIVSKVQKSQIFLDFAFFEHKTMPKISIVSNKVKYLLILPFTSFPRVVNLL